ncbi:hypothetical protein [Streptomyces endophyticus]|uniref:Ferredoxin n=1 Tax=Streptomyces endophyticus TaxID=714166 RepID=A0ABU6FGY5_9ACTN|nr:hypothetical protein [Streptomyces endophyticus]MEB8343326.1 hypothetical protein [Streptomyces endophyticus]
MTPVGCGTCGSQVLCEKYSPYHLQIQWTRAASATCPRLGAQGCPELRASIGRAVDEGRLEVTRRDQR